MKKTRVLLLMLSGMLFLSLKSNAQTAVTVIQGSTHTYSVTPVPGGSNYTYVWTISGGTASSPGSGATTANILWDGNVGQYTLSVHAINPLTGCAGNNQTLLVNVVALGGFTLTGPAAVCPKTDNQTGDFNVTVTYTGSGAWSYVLNDGRNSQTINVADGTSSSVTVIPGFVNASNTVSDAHILRITSVTTTGGTVTFDGTESGEANHHISVNVHPTPATSGIVQN